MSKAETITTSAAILGGVLAKLRKDRGLYQEDLGREAGVGASTWSRIEQGESQLSTEQLRAAAKKLGVSPASILGLAEDLETELAAKGIRIGDVPPKAWSGASSSGVFETILPYLGLGAGVGALMGAINPVGLVIPLAGAALAGVIAKHWPGGESGKNGASVDEDASGGGRTK